MTKRLKYQSEYLAELAIDSDCSQRAFPPLHKKFDVDVNSRGISVYVSD